MVKVPRYTFIRDVTINNNCSPPIWIKYCYDAHTISANEIIIIIIIIVIVTVNLVLIMEFAQNVTHALFHSYVATCVVHDNDVLL